MNVREMVGDRLGDKLNEGVAVFFPDCSVRLCSLELDVLRVTVRVTLREAVCDTVMLNDAV